ncbi:MAG: AAA family ATPase [Myxococcales bacterium]|nr:AAA family ATPase [Myxococcales bacterium]
MLNAPAVDARVLAKLAGAQGTSVLALTVTHAGEVPSLITGRWGTLCEVEAPPEAPHSIALRGISRARIVKCKGAESAPKVEVSFDPTLGAPASERSTLDALRLIVNVAASGAIRDDEREGSLDAALLATARALLPREILLDFVAVTAADAPARIASLLAAQAGARLGAQELEALVRKAAGPEEMPASLRAQLYAQVVEIERRLDVFDPSVPYEEGDDAVRLTRKLQQAGLPKSVRELVKSRLKSMKLSRHDSSDYATQVRNLELTAKLHWHPTPRPPVDLGRVREALDRAHHGMQKSKRRIEEWVSVRALGGEARSTVLCLAGPPGTGKTTIARAIAEALGRPFGRVAVGGMHDECELRGHRMSFHAAAPGRIIEEVARSGAMDPVLLLDEIDKIGTDTSRSPSAALMEILDPEQHTHFQDNFLSLPYDLSRVLFLCTANEIDKVRGPLRDRLEVIEIEGYSSGEKCAIARAHLLPNIAKELGLTSEPPASDAVLLDLIEGYTREGGVRSLRRALSALLRDRAFALARSGVREGDPQPPQGALTIEDTRRVLGAPRASIKSVPSELPVGASVGLSVSGDGGSPLLIEAGRLPASKPGGELSLTGHLGDVMRESARTALSHLRLYASAYGHESADVSGDWFVHVPEAAVPKDGPSAGVALFVAMLSALDGVAAPADVAMTGELSLHGAVLAVGGVRAKCLAAERAAMRKVLVPKGCEADVPEGLSCEVVVIERARHAVEALWPERAKEKRP